MTLTLTRDQVRSVDKLAVERYHIPGLILMENAGRGAARIILRTFGPTGSAVVFCGTGNNGGDGCVIARHLHNMGWCVRLVVVGRRERLSDDAEVNFRIVEAMDVDTTVTSDSNAIQGILDGLRGDEVLIDALLGTGFSGDVRSPTCEVITAINTARPRAVVAVDVPSGLDCETGRPANATIRADLTVTFVARKAGFDSPGAAEFLGRVEVTDIGAPRELITEVAGGGD
jgi:NAD(P)H-hydrate epimerase